MGGPKHSIFLPDLVFLGLISALSFFPFLGAVPLFDWDEINFAEAAREMLVTGDYFRVQINFEVFWEKPPLFFWLQVLAMKLFGVNEYAARFPNALVGVVTICSLYLIGTRMRGRVFGWLTAGFYFASLLPHFYFKSGIIDPTFNLFIFLGIYQLLKSEMWTRPKAAQVRRNFAFAGLFLGLATLTKGPVGLLVPGLVYLIYKLVYDRMRLPWPAIGRGAMVYLLVILTWFGSMLVFTAEGWETIQKFILYQVDLFANPVAGHGQPFYFHPLVFLIGCFPMAIFAIRGMFLRFTKPEDRALKRMMVVFFWTVMILFSIVTTKIIHYSSLTYYPAAFLAALMAQEVFKERKKLTRDMVFHFWFCVIFFGGFSLGINWIVNQLPAWSKFSENPFVQEALQIQVPWSGWEFIWGIIFIGGSGGAFYFLVNRNWQGFLGVQMLTTLLFMNGMNKTVVPKVAKYTQASAIEFYQEMKDRDVYFITAGFKSYAPYFYGEVKPSQKQEMNEEEWRTWLIRGNVDKDVYMVTREDSIHWQFFQWHRYFIPIYKKGGYVFLLRKK